MVSSTCRYCQRMISLSETLLSACSRPPQAAALLPSPHPLPGCPDRPPHPAGNCGSPPHPGPDPSGRLFCCSAPWSCIPSPDPESPPSPGNHPGELPIPPGNGQTPGSLPGPEWPCSAPGQRLRPPPCRSLPDMFGFSFSSSCCQTCFFPPQPAFFSRLRNIFRTSLFFMEHPFPSL